MTRTLAARPSQRARHTTSPCGRYPRRRRSDPHSAPQRRRARPTTRALLAGGTFLPCGFYRNATHLPQRWRLCVHDLRARHLRSIRWLRVPTCEHGIPREATLWIWLPRPLPSTFVVCVMNIYADGGSRKNSGVLPR
ncbi:hypothetical protein BDA96_03G191400 [Sorghum bicolor]|uniref:Uncharacterized protein n=1 Tax=Sorghum bicolor TaxID=4558 RepID=A0A921RDP2_SORBI|nr:hypothetical protein BDA96_03G191400 [Sorghum bicolor]